MKETPNKALEPTVQSEQRLELPPFRPIWRYCEAAYELQRFVARRGANRRFQLQKRRQLFICVHNKRCRRLGVR
jgi:hypothetical protein